MALLSVTVPALGACGADPDPVSVAVPEPPDTDREICAQLHAVLPTQIDGDDARPVQPASTLTAAWGDPPVLLRCGVSRPASLRATSFLSTVNGIDWLIDEQPSARVFTTIGRAVYLEVTVPAEHDPQVGPLVDLAEAVGDTIPPRPEVFR